MRDPRNADSRVHARGHRFRGRRVLTITAGGMSLAVLVATAVLWGLTDYALGKVERVAAFRDVQGRPPDSPGINVLLVGSDRREGISPEMLRKLNLGKAPGRRSDTMILAHISADHDSVVLVSLPRDWYVEIPAHRTSGDERAPAAMNKLNAAYALGGPDLAVSTVEHNTDIRIDHYVEVNFLGFVDVVNALGGVDVCTPEPIDDPPSGLKLPAGRSHLNGVQSLKYVRARKTLGSGSDLERIDRQQKFLGAMMQRAISTGTLLNPMKFTDFLNASLEAVRTDRRFSSGDLRRLALAVRDLDPRRMKFITVPIADPGVSTDEAGLAAVADKKKAAALFTRIREDDFGGRDERKRGNGTDGDAGRGTPRVDIPPDRIEVEVYNGTRTSGLGRRVTRDLREVGFLLEGSPGPADPPLDARQTVIQYGPSRGDSARTLRAAVPGSKLKMIPGLGDDIQVVAGSSYKGTRQVEVGSSGSGASGDAGSPGSPGTRFDARTAAQNPCA